MNESRYLWLLRTDSVGDTLWTKVMGGGLGDAGFDVVETPDLGYIIAGYTFSYSANPGVQADGWLVRTDSDGDTIWTNAYPGNNGVGGAFYSVQNTPDGGYILGGWDDANQWDGWMLKTDGSGNKLWGDSWGDITEAGWDHVMCAQSTPDGGCIGFGASYTYSAPSYDAWMIKIDSLPVGVEEKKAALISDSPIMFSVEPNPVIGAGKILFSIPNRQFICIDLFDATGRKLKRIYEGDVSGTKIVPFSAKGISSGIYILRLHSTSKDITKKIIIFGQ